MYIVLRDTARLEYLQIIYRNCKNESLFSVYLSKRCANLRYINFPDLAILIEAHASVWIFFMTRYLLSYSEKSQTSDFEFMFKRLESYCVCLFSRISLNFLSVPLTIDFCTKFSRKYNITVNARENSTKIKIRMKFERAGILIWNLTTESRRVSYWVQVLLKRRTS